MIERLEQTAVGHDLRSSSDAAGRRSGSPGQCPDLAAGEGLALHVGPTAQGRGVRRVLMDAVVKELRFNGIDEVRYALAL
jgi:GNAT superfamily N-acetyltransferase